jgi:hypothetical protein
MTLSLEIDEPPEVPVRYLPESEMVAMLRARHGKTGQGAARRWVIADHVEDRCGADHWAARICDFLAIDCWGNVGPVERRNPVHGFEIKSSRADWLTELRDPAKAEAFKRYCDHWWLVVSDRRIVRDGELPDGWGLLAVAGTVLRCVKPAPLLPAELWPRPLVASFARAVAKSARAAS